MKDKGRSVFVAVTKKGRDRDGQVEELRHRYRQQSEHDRSNCSNAWVCFIRSRITRSNLEH
jgi:hypothetical protein